MFQCRESTIRRIRVKPVLHPHRFREQSSRSVSDSPESERLYQIRMTVFIGHSSALAYWRSAIWDSPVTPVRADPRPGHIPSIDDAMSFAELLPYEDRRPLHVLVADPLCRRRSSLLHSKLWHMPASSRSFVEAAKHCYVSVPGACFVQLASMIEFLDLLKVGMELCGTYSLTRSSMGFVSHDWDRSPSTATMLLRYADKACRMGLRGARKARSAARFIADGSHSPAETIVYLLLCLPVRYGGYGIERPLLNRKIEITGKSYRLVDDKLLRAKSPYVISRRPDLLWPKSGIALEYESSLAHSGGDKLSSDSTRRGELEDTGVHVLTLAKGQLYNTEEFDRIAHILIRATGKRQRSLTRDQMEKRMRLREELLYGKRVHGG